MHEELIDQVLEDETDPDKGLDMGVEGRPERKKYYRKRQEERPVEEELAPYGTAVSYKEYQAHVAEKQGTVPAPKSETETESKEPGTSWTIV